MTNKIRGTPFEEHIQKVADANLDAVDSNQLGKWQIVARLEIAAEQAESTAAAINAAVRDEMQRIIDETPAPHQQSE